MAAPLLQAQVDISAPVSTVWALVSDFRRMPQWSPQCRLMRALGPLRHGTRTINVNRRNNLFWPTTSTVLEVIPEQKLAFRVNTNNTIWSYELQPIAEGTRVIESRHAENGVEAGVEHDGERPVRRDRELRAGTRRGHEHLAGQDQSRGREQLAVLRGILRAVLRGILRAVLRGILRAVLLRVSR